MGTWLGENNFEEVKKSGKGSSVAPGLQTGGLTGLAKQKST